MVDYERNIVIKVIIVYDTVASVVVGLISMPVVYFL
jgi:hypothetical protein